MIKLKNIRRVCEALLILFVVVSASGVLSTSIYGVRAQTDDIEAGIYPSEGTGSTEILIRFLTRNASIGNVEKADLFWDGVSVGLNINGNRSADNSYNYLLKVPSEHPLSDIGNHTITASSFVFNYGQVSFNFTFRITEFVPSPEYIALNATYYSLLTNHTGLLVNHTDLLNRYTSLLANYSTLLADYNSTKELASNYNSLSANYNSLLADFNALSANYNSLLTSYNNLHSLYSLFLTNYTKLVENQNSLSSIYTTLREDYASLETSYHALKTSYDSLVGEQTTARNLSYIFIASTIIFVATTVYLVSRKPKLPLRSR